MTTPWAVPRDWVGETAVVLGGGPSMSKEVVDYVRGKARVIAVTTQGIEVQTRTGIIPALAPWADVLYAGDAKWWNDPFNQPRALAFEGLRVTVADGLSFKQVLSLQSSRNAPYDPRPNYIYKGGHSGYQAVHLAAKFGAKRILLCGFDLRDVNGKSHWFGHYYSKTLNTRPNYRNWANNFQPLFKFLAGAGVEVLNCSPGSSLRGAKMAKLEEVLH